MDLSPSSYLLIYYKTGSNRFTDLNLGIGVVIKVTGAALGDLKLQCVKIATLL